MTVNFFRFRTATPADPYADCPSCWCHPQTGMRIQGAGSGHCVDCQPPLTPRDGFYQVGAFDGLFTGVFDAIVKADRDTIQRLIQRLSDSTGLWITAGPLYVHQPFAGWMYASDFIAEVERLA